MVRLGVDLPKFIKLALGGLYLMVFMLINGF